MAAGSSWSSSCTRTRAGTGDPTQDRLKLAALEERWGHRGFTTWSEITLPPLTAIANALAGRGGAKERYRREPPKLQLRQGLWAPWLESAR